MPRILPYPVARLTSVAPITRARPALISECALRVHVFLYGVMRLRPPYHVAVKHCGAAPLTEAMGWSLPLPPPPLPDAAQRQQLDRLHKSYQRELEQSQLEKAAMARRMTRLSERFASHLFDVRRRHLLRLCLLALRSHVSGNTGRDTMSTPSAAPREKEEPWSEQSSQSRADKLNELELEEHLEQVAHVSHTRLRKNRVACAMQLLRVRRLCLMRLCLMALRAHAAHGIALRNSYAASFIAHRLVGRDVLGIVLRSWRQHVVQLVSTRELHAQLSSVVN